MTECGVPEDVQADLIGGNARRLLRHRGEAVRHRRGRARSTGPTGSPQGPELDEWADIVAHPRENPEKIAEHRPRPDEPALGSTGAAAGKGTY